MTVRACVRFGRLQPSQQLSFAACLRRIHVESAFTMDALTGRRVRRKLAPRGVARSPKAKWLSQPSARAQSTLCRMQASASWFSLRAPRNRAFSQAAAHVCSESTLSFCCPSAQVCASARTSFAGSARGFCCPSGQVCASGRASLRWVCMELMLSTGASLRERLYVMRSHRLADVGSVLPAGRPTVGRGGRCGGRVARGGRVAAMCACAERPRWRHHTGGVASAERATGVAGRYAARHLASVPHALPVPVR